MRTWLLGVVVVVTSACGGDDTAPQGELGGHCYPNGTCNVSLECSGGICLAIDSGIADAPADTGRDAFVCSSNDSVFEPNDSISTAYVTGVASTTRSQVYGSLAICPAGDRDTFAITITTANDNLEVLVAYQAGGAVLQASILNSGGVPIANASPVSGMSDVIRAYTPNLPTGTYYAQVYGGLSAINNYQLTLTVTGP